SVETLQRARDYPEQALLENAVLLGFFSERAHGAQPGRREFGLVAEADEAPAHARRPTCWIPSRQSFLDLLPGRDANSRRAVALILQLLLQLIIVERKPVGVVHRRSDGQGFYIIFWRLPLRRRDVGVLFGK